MVGPVKVESMMTGEIQRKVSLPQPRIITLKSFSEEVMIKTTLE